MERHDEQGSTTMQAMDIQVFKVPGGWQWNIKVDGRAVAHGFDTKKRAAFEAAADAANANRNR